MYIYIYMCVYIYVYICVCVFVCIYINIYGARAPRVNPLRVMLARRRALISKLYYIFLCAHHPHIHINIVWLFI